MLVKEFDSIDDWFKVSRLKKAKSSSPTGSFSLSFSSTKFSPVPVNNYIRPTLTNIKKSPEAMVKITGNSKDAGRLKAHFEYITRNGEIELTNQEGEKITDLASIKDELEQWKATGIPLENGNQREAMHIVLSMPAGTNPEGMLKAVEQFAEQEFSGHNYVYAQHLDTQSPHVHLCVAMRDNKGQRLNPRKDTLFAWRLKFAAKLREQGIDAVATKRQHRFKTKKGYNQKIMHIDKKQKDGKLSKVTTSLMKEAELAFKENKLPSNPLAEKIKNNFDKIEAEYRKLLNGKELSNAEKDNIREILDNRDKQSLTKMQELFKLIERKSISDKQKELDKVKDKELGNDR